MRTLDMTGKACPIPVVEARKVLEAGEEATITVLVDNVVATENLQKMAQGKGYSFSLAQPSASVYAVTLSLNGAANQGVVAPSPAFVQRAEAAPSIPSQGATLLVTKSHMGEGSQELGKILLKGFLFTLTEWDIPPKALYFLNSGVELVCEGSNALEDLKALTQKGTAIHACGTCLNYYALTEKLALGQVVNMMDISTAMAAAPQLITL